jgi:hypothetical protein
VPLRNPEYWRARAEEARSIAEGMHSRDGMQAMLRIADLYDQLASRSEPLAEVLSGREVDGRSSVGCHSRSATLTAITRAIAV